MKSYKYYLLKRNSAELLDCYLREFDNDKRAVIEKRTSLKHDLLLIEMTSNKDYTETVTNFWTLYGGCASTWEKYTKRKLMYDYTGVIFPLIHENGNVMLWEDYLKSKRLTKRL